MRLLLLDDEELNLKVPTRFTDNLKYKLQKVVIVTFEQNGDKVVHTTCIVIMKTENYA